MNFSPRAGTPNLASSLSLGCQDLMTDPHFSFLNFLITFPLVRRVSSPDVDCCRAAAAFPITFSRTRPQFLLPAIHPADWGCARHQRVCPGRDRRRIPTGLTVDDRSERRNICVRARPARAQPPRSAPNRCFFIIRREVLLSFDSLRFDELNERTWCLRLVRRTVADL